MRIITIKVVDVTEGQFSKKRFSKKRQSILAIIKSTKVHPSADWVFEQIKKEYPSISLGTVYRNIDELVQSGQIRSLGVINGRERFDGCIAEHSHAVCTKCGRVLDIEKLNVEINAVIPDFTPTYREVRIEGICGSCAKNRKS